MKKLKLLTLLLFLVLFLTACGISSTNIRQVKTYVGTEALSMEFLPTAPPSEIFAPEEGEEPVAIILDLVNNGAHNIKGGYLALAVEKNYMKINDWFSEDQPLIPIGSRKEIVTFDLDGRSKFNPTGGRMIVEIDAATLPIDAQTDHHKSSIRASACYDFETEASGSVCVDTDVNNIKPLQKPCEVSDVSFSGGQGAPISVDNIEVRMITSGDYIRPQFLIYISNRGRGQPFNKKYIKDMCSSGTVPVDSFNSINLEDVRFSSFSLKGGDIECSPLPLKLRNDKDYFRCTLKPGLLNKEDPGFLSQIYVRLSYGYAHSISTEVDILKII